MLRVKIGQGMGYVMGDGDWNPAWGTPDDFVKNVALRYGEGTLRYLSDAGHITPEEVVEGLQDLQDRVASFDGVQAREVEPGKFSPRRIANEIGLQAYKDLLDREEEATKYELLNEPFATLLGGVE